MLSRFGLELDSSELLDASLWDITTVHEHPEYDRKLAYKLGFDAGRNKLNDQLLSNSVEMKHRVVFYAGYRAGEKERKAKEERVANVNHFRQRRVNGVRVLEQFQ